MRERLRSTLAALSPRDLPLEDRRAAGVMLLLEGAAGSERVIFQVRTHTVRNHRGEIGFPGGRRDLEDGTLLDTALRETQEEVGVPPDAVDILGRLDDTTTRDSNYLIRPYVGFLHDGVSPRVAARREVEELLRVPVDYLLDPACHAWKVVSVDGRPEPMPAYRYGEHLIWGATARILGQFLGIAEAAR